MEVVLLGTGGADGWPNPWCTCASCETQAGDGHVRAQTAALVDGDLLLDLGPDVPRSALRLGRSLAAVRTVLLTHAHSDHTGPPALLWRSWSTRSHDSLRVVGPPAAVAACRDWVGPHDPVTFEEVSPGAEVDVDHRAGGGSRYRARAVEATHGGPEIGPAVLWDVARRGPAPAEDTAGDGQDRVVSRLLWATDTAPLRDRALAQLEAATAVEGPLDLLGLECSFGDARVDGVDHHGLDDWPLTVAELRRRGVVGDATRLLAVHLGHGNPPEERLQARLAGWGASAGRDGDVHRVARTKRATSALTEKGSPQADVAEPRHRPAVSSRPCRRTSRRTLVTGGARSGKSAHAQRLLLAEPDVCVVATGVGREDDADWRARVAAHRADRPDRWRTVETSDLAGVLADPPAPALLVDDLGLWLTHVLDAAGAWEGPDGAREALDPALRALVDALRRTAARRVVLVGNEVGAGVHPAHVSGRVFRDALGRAQQRLAQECDEVLLCVAGRVLPLR